MKIFIELILILPFLLFLISLLLPKNNEKLISKFVYYTIGLHTLSLFVFIAIWIYNDFKAINLREFSIYKGEEMNFFIDFYFDKSTAVFAIVGAVLTFLVSSYSSVYLHREPGFKRFFIQFYFSMQVI